jgi:hypothetical protein
MQLDFLTGYAQDVKVSSKQRDVQYSFWDENYNVQYIPRKPRFTNVEKFFKELDYTKVPAYKSYWEEVTPKNDSQLFQRWLFAFMSVHTSWEKNVDGYMAIKDWWLWFNKWDVLHKLIDDSRVGMQNNRTKYLEEFSHNFWKNPSAYKKQNTESWTRFRNRLKTVTKGLGPAKTSFALELCDPVEARLTCLDTHMFKAYSLDQVRDARQYEDIERHWVDMCNMWNIPAYVARCLYWDTKQGYTDSRYWSHVFEAEQN